MSLELWQANQAVDVAALLGKDFVRLEMDFCEWSEAVQTALDFAGRTVDTDFVDDLYLVDMPAPRRQVDADTVSCRAIDVGKSVEE